MTPIDTALQARSKGECELCGAGGELVAWEVSSMQEQQETAVALCATCAGQLEGDDALDANHWFCLQGSIWSEVAPVQVLSYRLLQRLASEHAWAAEQLDQAYLDDERLKWAKEASVSGDSGVEVRDSNGALLATGDSITLIKDLDVKGTTFVAKRGTRVKGIRVSDDPGFIEGKVNGVSIMIKTEFVRKA